MVLAFEKFEEIETLPTIQEKQRAWLKDYEGLNFSIALEEKHKLKWATQPKQYKDRTFSSSINCIAPRKDRLIIELEPNDNNLKVQYDKVKNKLKEIKAGNIESSHKGKSTYLWVEFTRDLTKEEKKRFLTWITPIGSIADINFCYEKKVFQVLYATHWRHSENRELPIEYQEGEKIDFDKLNIPKQELKTTKVSKNGFTYEVGKKERIVETEDIPVYDYLSFEKLKPDKSFIVQEFLKPDSVTMVYSPPAKFKTILMQNLAMSIANGREWLGLKTKKYPVLYCDGENSNQRVKETLMSFYQGMKLKRKKFPFYMIKSGLMMDAKKNINLGFSVFLERLIEEKKIKVIFFDTLHRFAYYDENKSDDVNKIYTEIFKPLKEKYNLAIIFLHHSLKGNGRTNPVYRGSGDFLGMVDVSYRIEAENKTKKFKLINEKNRGGEIAEIKGQIFFEENFIKIERLNEVEEEKEIKNKFLEVCDKILVCFDRSSELSRKDIMEYISATKYEYSRATFDRALKWLCERKEALEKTENRTYILREVQT